MSKLDDLKREQKIYLILNKFEPEIPESFPKNYTIQIVYEDGNFTGNQKFIDFDENII